MEYRALLACGSAAVALAMTPIDARAQFVPPAGYSGTGAGQVVTVASDPGAPTISRISDVTASSLIRVDPGYRRGSATGHAKVVGAFSIAETRKRHLVSAWSPGFIPVTLLFSDGQCYSLLADYEGGMLLNGRLSKVGCEQRHTLDEPPLPSPPLGQSLRFVGTAWGYGAWIDQREGTTIITAPGAKTFKPLFKARMISSAVMAMNGPDWPGGNVTLVGKVRGKLTVVTLEVGY